jgi:hypothetical protein
MVRGWKIKVREIINLGKRTKFERTVTSIFGVRKKNLIEKWGFEVNIEVL